MDFELSSGYANLEIPLTPQTPPSPNNPSSTAGCPLPPTLLLPLTRTSVSVPFSPPPPAWAPPSEVLLHRLLPLFSGPAGSHFLAASSFLQIRPTPALVGHLPGLLFCTFASPFGMTFLLPRSHSSLSSFRLISKPNFLRGPSFPVLQI